MGTSNPALLLVVLIGVVAVWFALIGVVWLRLIKRHPEKYESMGRPHFFTRIGSIATLRFVFARQHRLLGDRALGVASDAALITLVLYLVGFAVLVVKTS